MVACAFLIRWRQMMRHGWNRFRRRTEWFVPKALTLVAVGGAVAAVALFLLDR